MLIKINEDKPAFIKTINNLKERSGEKTASGAVMYAILSNETQTIEVRTQHDEITRLKRQIEALNDKLEGARQAFETLSTL
jgi:polyhydroxyalkanoate synthesis regulator phasin